MKGQLKDSGCNANWAGGSVLSLEQSYFHLAEPQEEAQAVLLLSGSRQIRKPLVVCMPKPFVGRHLHSTAFSQEGSVLKERVSALLLSMPFSTRDHLCCSAFGMGDIKSTPHASIYWCNVGQRSSSGRGGLSSRRCCPASLKAAPDTMCRKQFF